MGAVNTISRPCDESIKTLILSFNSSFSVSDHLCLYTMMYYVSSWRYTIHGCLQNVPKNMIEIVSNMLWSTSALVNVQPPSSLSTLCSRPRLKMFFTMTMIWWWWQWYDDGHHWSCEKCYNLDDIDDGDDADNGNGGIVWQTWRKGTRLWGYLHGAQPGCDLFKKRH